MYTLCFIIEILLNMPAVVMKTHRAVNTGWTFDPALLDPLTVVMLCPLPTTYLLNSTFTYWLLQKCCTYYWFSTTEAYLCNGYFGTLEGYVTNQVTIYSLARRKYFSFDLPLQSFGTTFNAKTIFGWHSIIFSFSFRFGNCRKRNLKPSETTKKWLVFSRNSKQY